MRLNIEVCQDEQQLTFLVNQDLTARNNLDDFSIEYSNRSKNIYIETLKKETKSVFEETRV